MKFQVFLKKSYKKGKEHQRRWTKLDSGGYYVLV